VTNTSPRVVISLGHAEGTGRTVSEWLESVGKVSADGWVRRGGGAAAVQAVAAGERLALGSRGGT